MAILKRMIVSISARFQCSRAATHAQIAATLHPLDESCIRVYIKDISAPRSAFMLSDAASQFQVPFAACMVGITAGMLAF